MIKKITVILFLFILLISTSAYAKDKIIVKFKGPNNKTTPVFKIKPDWQIKYNTVEPDRHFSIVVHDEYGKYIGLAANAIGPKKGLYYQEKGGTYYLDVTADGNWYIDIIQIKKRK